MTCKWLLIGILTSISCDSFLRSNPDYCGDDSTCSSETVCNLTFHRCEPGVAAPVVLTSIAPSVAALAGGEVVVVTGMNFRTGATVTFNGVAATQVEVRSATELAVTVPRVDGMCGPATVAVTNPGATAVASSALFRFKIGTPSFAQVPGGLPGTPTDAHDLKAVDFNNDGKMDLGLLARSVHKVRLYIGNGQINFSMLSGDGFDTGDSVQNILFSKINDDNLPDLIAWNPAVLNTYFNTNGTGLQAAGTLPAFYGAVAVGPVAGNGNWGDLIAARGDMKVLDVRFAQNAGAGPPYTIVNSPLSIPEISNSVVLADINGGPLDIVAAQPNGSKAYLFFGGSAGAFTGQGTVSLGIAPIKIVAVDMNNDGRQDLVTIGGLASSISGLSVTRNRDGNTFTTPDVVTTLDTPEMLATGNSGYDFNCDDRPDVVVYNTDAITLQIYLNDGAGVLTTPPISVPLDGKGVDSFAVADLDGDNKPDLAVITTASDGSHSGMILRNTSH